MPSYRYTRDINPEDLQNGPGPEYSKKQKAGNWWHYHWKLVLVIAVALVMLLLFLRDILTKVTPDFTVGIVTPNTLPEQATAALSDALAPLVGDVNGDGEVLVQVEVYTIDLSDAADPGSASDPPAEGAPDAPDGGFEDSLAAGLDPYSQMAGVTKLMAAFETGESVLLLAEPGQAQYYQDAYSLFGTAEGALAPEGSDVEALTLSYTELAVLEEMPFSFYDGTEYSVAELLDGYRVGLRALYGTRLESAEDGEESWQRASALLAQLVG